MARTGGNCGLLLALVSPVGCESRNAGDAAEQQSQRERSDSNPSFRRPTPLSPSRDSYGSSTRAAATTTTTIIHFLVPVCLPVAFDGA